MDTQQELIISNERDAFNAIRSALKDEISEDVKISFDNWPKITIELEGDGYESTLTPSVMAALVDLQHGLNRTYAKIVLDRNARFLNDIERQQLEFKAKVEDGCTLITVDLKDYAKNIIEKLSDKMTGKELTIVAVTAITAWASVTVLKANIESKAAGKSVEQDTIKTVKLSEEETKRMQIFADAMTYNSALRTVHKDAQETNLSLLKGVSDADSIEINGIAISKSDAIKISKNIRSESKAIQLNGNYHVLTVDTSLPDEVKIRLLHLDSHREFSAKFKDDSLDKSQIAILQKAEWSRNPKEKVYLSINATELRGEITTATIVSVKEQPPQKNP